MPLSIRRAPRLVVSFEVSFLSEAEREGRLAAQQRFAAAEVASVARCPRCQVPLIARMGCCGPYFHCACHESLVPGYHARLGS
jgi:hypothetical protein